MLLLYLFGVLCLSVAAFLWSFRARLQKGTPAPPHHWLLGSLPTMMKNKHRFFDWHCDMREQFKRTWHLTIPGRVAFKLVTGDCIQHVLKNTDIYVKTLSAFDVRVWKELTGEAGLLMSQDQMWKDGRKCISLLFSGTNLRTKIEEAFLRSGKILVDKLIKLEGKEVDMQDLFFRYTMDSFCEISLGVSPGGLLQDKDSEFSVCFDRIQQRIIARRMEHQLVSRLKMFIQTKDEKLMASDFKYVVAYMDPIIKNCQEMAKTDAAPTLNMVSLLVADARKRGTEISDAHIQDHCLSFLLAGRDTTASALTSIFMLLDSHPEVEQKIVDEIKEKIGGSVPTHESVADLTYCEAVFNEAMRLYPPAPLNYRKCRTSDTLPDGTFIPAGCEVHWSPWVNGRNPDLYPDPLSFKPERWFASPPPPPLHLFDNPVFGAGPRLCLGKAMAYFEVKVVMVLLFQRLRFKLVPGQRLSDYALGLTLIREHGQLMKVRLSDQ